MTNDANTPVRREGLWGDSIIVSLVLVLIVGSCWFCVVVLFVFISSHFIS